MFEALANMTPPPPPPLSSAGVPSLCHKPKFLLHNTCTSNSHYFYSATESTTTTAATTTAADAATTTTTTYAGAVPLTSGSHCVLADIGRVVPVTVVGSDKKNKCSSATHSKQTFLWILTRRTNVPATHIQNKLSVGF